MSNPLVKQLTVLLVRTWAWACRAALPAGLLAQWRCARRIDRMTRRLLRMRARIQAMSGHVKSGALTRPLDPDGSLRAMLGELKDETRKLRYQLAQWHLNVCGEKAGAHLSTSMAVLNRIAADTYAAADKLAWDIAEHDDA